MTEQTQSRYGPSQPGSSGAEDASAKEKAAETAQAGKQAAGEVAQTAAGQAKEVAQETQAQARNLVGEARDQLRGHVGEQHRNAVTNLRSLGDEFRSMAGNAQQGGVAGDLVGRAAGHAHSMADWLDGRQPEDVLDEVRRFARRRPGTFLLGALAAGVLAGRLTRGAVAAHSDDGEKTSSPPAGFGDAGPSASPVTDAYGPAVEYGPTVEYGPEGARHAHGAEPAYGATPTYGAEPGYGAAPVYGSEPTYGSAPATTGGLPYGSEDPYSGQGGSAS